MKLFTTDKILVELTSEELEILQTCLNSASVRMMETGWPKSYQDKVEQLWRDLYHIEKSLPF